MVKKNKKYITKLLAKYIGVCLILLLYVTLMVSVIGWGLPNSSHPFPYHMDEWHQLQGVRALYKYGTPNIEGAAHGSIFQFLLTGIYLIPFVVLGVINPFSVTSILSNVQMQEKIFIVLRSNTLLFGILSIIVVSIIAKKYLKTNPGITAFFFAITPLWITLSNYYKYDIALVFWILLSLFFLLRFGDNPTFKNYIVAAIFCALAFATKVAALPQIAIYIVSFFYFTHGWSRKFKWLITGVGICLLLSIVVGVPDLVFRLERYKEYFSSNIFAASEKNMNFMIGTSNWLQYVVFIQLPRIFGYGFFVLAVISILYLLLISILKNKKYKKEMFIFISFVVYALSLLPLGLGASGNRLLVLLPFLALLITVFVNYILQIFKDKRVLIYSVIAICAVIQFYYSYHFIFSKYEKAPPQVASEWILQNIPKGTTIGIENNPIYESPPDFILKEYYQKQEDPKFDTYFEYKIVDVFIESLPSYIIITNRVLHKDYFRNSSKKKLIKRLEKEKFKIVAEFKTPEKINNYFGNELNTYLSGLNASLPITVFKRSKI